MRYTYLKGLSPKFIAGISLITLACSCSSQTDELIFEKAAKAPPVHVAETSQLRTAMSYDVNQIHPVALDYVDNAKTLLYATGAIQEADLRVTSYETYIRANVQ